MPTLAHLSDLHIGKSPATERAAWRLREALEDVDHIAITGDITHSGSRAELETFLRIFGDLGTRLSMVPGNHDRLGDDVGDAVMDGPRVQLTRISGGELLRIDSTSDHNTSIMMPHGELSDFDMAALSEYKGEGLCFALLHHHPVRLPEDSFTEWLGSKLRITQARELREGSQLLNVLAGHVGIILHGHRHVPRHVRIACQGGVMDLYNAGSSTELQVFRVFEHDAGAVRSVTWRPCSFTRTKTPDISPRELSVVRSRQRSALRRTDAVWLQSRQRP